MKRTVALSVLVMIMVAVLVSPFSVDAAAINPRCPLTVANPPDPITNNTAFLIGHMGSIGLSGNPTVTFEWGTTSGIYTFASPGQVIIVDGLFGYLAGGLQPCTTYYYRIHVVVAGFYNFFTNEVMFKTTGCTVTNYGTPGDYNSNNSPGGGSAGAPANDPVTRPFLPGMVGATLSTTKVGAGEPVTVKATISNTGTVNGNTKVTVYVNGSQDSSQGLTLASGEIRDINFTLIRNEPGVYNVVVNNTPAGSFTVDYFTNNDALIYGLIALFTIGIAGVIYLIARRRPA